MDDAFVDLLNRKQFIDDIIVKLYAIKDNKSSSFIMIDGEWGTGKTTVLQMLKTEIKQNVNIVEYNCWEKSFYNDPLIAIISCVTEQMNEFSDINNVGLKIMNYFGFGYTINWNIFKFINISIKKQKKENSKFKTLDTYVSEFKNILTNFNKNNFGVDRKDIRVILVDELDRCLPEYAIKVLERLYLLFKNIPNTVVIIASNNNQLQHSLNKIFGVDFSSNEYLKKFIDYTFKLDFGVINNENIIKKFEEYFSLFKMNYDDVNLSKFLSYILQNKKIREIEMTIDFIIDSHRITFSYVEQQESVCLFELLITFIGMKRLIKKASNTDSFVIDEVLPEVLDGYLSLYFENLKDNSKVTPDNIMHGELVDAIGFILYAINGNDKISSLVIKESYSNYLNDKSNCIDDILYDQLLKFILSVESRE